MLTFDGIGYGKSDYWHQVAIRTAKELDEDCFCWHKRPMILTFGDTEFNIKISCKVQKSRCRKSFEKTEHKIEQMFKDFYK